MAQTYFGIYRAVVLANNDPMRRNRVQVLVSAISGQSSGWALPCQPHGLMHVPNIGATVWVMFEVGEPSSPFYMGAMS